MEVKAIVSTLFRQARIFGNDSVKVFVPMCSQDFARGGALGDFGQFWSILCGAQRKISKISVSIS